MLRKKKGMPHEGEFVFCTISKVQYHSVFANLDEYERKSGMIHISEISPGRIRNINDYVKEGKVVICKILRINMDRGHIDLSLRRVNEAQRRAKVEERKRQTIAENIVQSYAKINKLDVLKTYDSLCKDILEKYETLYDAFEDVVENKAKLPVDKAIADVLLPLIKERIKEKEVVISADFHIESYEENGVDLVCELMSKIEKVGVSVRFLGAGNFKFTINDREYEAAEKTYAKIEPLVEKAIKDNETEYKLVRA